ncbi:hypothetical protein Taro_023564 [Colocasia esculenta]|uniref:Uncharacterized protein n=1 Tax=Colocasia esculenta TaxID=4460 RepID=A0A843VHQ2_COLES|nr:hypothetical protein [Colocasia esculenta]
MDANPKLTACDVDVSIPDLLRPQIQNAPEIFAPSYEFCVKTQSRKPLIRRRATPFSDLLRLEGSPTIEEEISITGWRSASTRNPGLVQAMQMQAHTQAALQAQLEAQAQVPVPQAQNHGGPSIMERFKRMLPPSFKGESDPLLVESWMRQIEKIFRAIRCADDNRVTLATYMLQERADVWWSSLLHTRFEDGAVAVYWDEFDGLHTEACS